MNEATDFHLPSVRKMFVPDEGHVIIDVDLAGADAQVVAWEANDPILKEIFRRRVKVHAENAKKIYGPIAGPDGKKEPYYTRAKMGVHATNYGASARAVSEAIGISHAEAEAFQEVWFHAHPWIKDWHTEVRKMLYTNKTVWNKFGYRRIYFDRADSILPEALAWIPQSTVACITNRALERIDRVLPNVGLLLQVHDSLVMQVPEDELEATLPKIQECFNIVVPYDDPLIIPVGVKMSTKSWGDCK